MRKTGRITAVIRSLQPDSLKCMKEVTMTDVIVVGGGHAGCEAALATARSGLSTVLCSLDTNWIASMPCNPSVGGPAKGIVVREISQKYEDKYTI